MPAEACAEVASVLSRFLANSYVLYVKTHGYHWNVRGPQFGSLHTLFEQHYTDLALAIDELAERIRALGENAPGSMAMFQELSELKEAEGVPIADEMIRDLAADHVTLSRIAAEVVDAAEEVEDVVTADMATSRKLFHDKAAWMLRAYLA